MAVLLDETGNALLDQNGSPLLDESDAQFSASDICEGSDVVPVEDWWQ